MDENNICTKFGDFKLNWLDHFSHRRRYRAKLPHFPPHSFLNFFCNVCDELDLKPINNNPF